MVDPISLEIFKNMLISIPEEMGVTLVRTAYSPNIKERRDYSCAFFDEEGREVSQAAHIPAHLGSMPASVHSAIEVFPSFEPGDMVILNDPFLGGTHLCDITLVSPVFAPDPMGKEKLFGFVASRAHHDDVGGMSPGSLPLSTEVYQEGIIIPPLKIAKAGAIDEDLLTLICRNVRTPEVRRGDLEAQIGAGSMGQRRVHELVARYGMPLLKAHMDALLEYSERMTRAAIAAIPRGRYRFQDYLDDDGVTGEPVLIAVEIAVAGDEIIIDFTGTSPQCLGCTNACLAVSESAALYVVSCITGGGIPANSGSLAPVKVIAPLGSVVNPTPPAAAAAGTTEVAQRIIDVLFGALAQALPNLIPAASQGTMNVLTIGGYDPFRNQHYTYCETLGGGTGAGPGYNGTSGVHSHMSNTLNTPIEALELQFPFRIQGYSLRSGSGGIGKFRGGDGLIRRYLFLSPTTASLHSDRRKLAPYGLEGGATGERGRNILKKKDSSEIVLPSKFTRRVGEGEELSLLTPGGGGWGRPEAP